MDEMVEDGETELTLVQGPIICEPACSVPLVSGFVNLGTKALVLACQTLDLFVCHGESARETQEAN